MRWILTIVLGIVLAAHLPACDDDPEASKQGSGKGAITGTITLADGVTCGTGTGDDCKGYVYITALGCGDPGACGSSPLKATSIADADLGRPEGISYELDDLPAGQTVHISAALYETATSPKRPEPGDLLSPVPAPSATVAEGSPVTVDLLMSRVP